MSLTEKSNANVVGGDEVTVALSSSEMKEERKLSSISIPSIPSLASVSVATNGPSNSFDLSGKIIIKAQLDDDIRLVPIHNDEITYDELLVMMQRIFKGGLKADDDVLVKYKDEDGDLVTIIDTADLSLAIQSSRILKLKLIRKKKEEPVKERKVADIPVSIIRRELKELRDRTTQILDYLDQNEGDKVMPRGTSSTGAQTVEKEKHIPTASFNMNTNGMEEVKQVSDMARVPSSPVPVKEFDPLGQQKLGQGVDPSQPAVVVNGGAPPKRAPTPQQQLQQGPPQPQQVIHAFQSLTSQAQSPTSSSVSSTPSKQLGHEHHQLVQQQPRASSLFDSSGATPVKTGLEQQHGMMMGPSQPQPPTPQQSRYPTSVPTSQSMPPIPVASMPPHGMMPNTQQQPPQPQQQQPQPPPPQQVHPQAGAYPGTNVYPQQQQQQYPTMPYGGSTAPTPSYQSGGPAVQSSYPTTAQPSRPTGVSSYPTGGQDTTSTPYPQMPPTSSNMQMMSAHNPSTPAASSPMPQQPSPYGAPPPQQQQQYNTAMPQATPAYRPQGPPPPAAGGGMGMSNPYSRSAVPPPPQVGTYRPQM